MDDRRLLAVFAHPDDETIRCGGALALLARRGIQIWVLCATRGEAGIPDVDPKEAGRVRAAELQCACEALGIEPPRFLDYRDGTLDQVDEAEAVAQVMSVVRELRPQVLLTWPPDGMSGHLDHIAVSRWATLAFEQSDALGPEAPGALYHLVVPRSVADSLGRSFPRAVPDEEVTLTLDVTPIWEQKLAALQCHRTQLAVSPMAWPESQRWFMKEEYFQRATARAAQDFFLELRPGDTVA